MFWFTKKKKPFKKVIIIAASIKDERGHEHNMCG